MLVQILRGSRRKRLLELGLDKSPVFGYFNHLDESQVRARVDRAILDGYLQIKYDYRLPVLVYTRAGWEIEKATYAEELFATIEQNLSMKPAKFDVERLKDKNRQVIWLLLDKIQETGDSRFVPFLETWAEHDYKKVQRRIRHVIDRLLG